MDDEIVGYMVLEIVQKSKGKKAFISIEKRGVFDVKDDAINACINDKYGYIEIYNNGSVKGLIRPNLY
jgi:hypothetical protein